MDGRGKEKIWRMSFVFVHIGSVSVRSVGIGKLLELESVGIVKCRDCKVSKLGSTRN